MERDPSFWRFPDLHMHAVADMHACPPPLKMLKMKVLNKKGREHGDPVENMRVVLSTLSKKSTFHTDWVL